MIDWGENSVRLKIQVGAGQDMVMSRRHSSVVIIVMR
jgi:hypothetical protein